MPDESLASLVSNINLLAAAADRAAERIEFTSDALRSFRISAGLSISDLASVVVVRDRTVERWLRGDMKPSPSTLVRVERLLAALTAV